MVMSFTDIGIEFSADKVIIIYLKIEMIDNVQVSHSLQQSKQLIIG